jgi:hypothetical protein
MSRARCSPSRPRADGSSRCGSTASTRYLTVDQLRLLGSSETDLAVFERLKPKSPNLDLRPLDAKQAPKLSDPQLLGKDVVLEGYVHLDDRSPMIVTKLEPRAS